MVFEEDVVVQHQRPLQQHVTHGLKSYPDKPVVQRAANILQQVEQRITIPAPGIVNL